MGSSADGDSNEEVNFTSSGGFAAPIALTVYIHGYDTGAAPSATGTLFQWAVGTADAGNTTLAITPAGPTTIGGTKTVTATFTGLLAGDALHGRRSLQRRHERHRLDRPADQHAVTQDASRASARRAGETRPSVFSAGVGFPAVPGRRRRREVEMERVLGTPALFATAYGNVGSSIYYALGLTAVYALGLTPLVFVVAGIVFAATAATYAEGTARFPEAGGSASFSRHAFDELVSFVAGWAQMLVYIVTVAVSAFFVPHYLSIFWEPLNTNPWDIVGGVVVIVVLVALNVVGVQEAAKLSISLAVVDFATQVLLVIVGFALVFSPDTLVENVHWGVAPTWSNLAISIPVAMLAYTGVETVSNLAEEARDPARTVPNSYKLVAGAVFAIYFTLPLVALSALPVERIDGELTTLLALPPEEGGYANDPILGVVENIGLEGLLLDAAEIYVGVLAATILVIATNAGVIGASRITYSMATYRQLPEALRRLHPRFKTPWLALVLFAGIAPILVILPGDVNFVGTLYSLGATLSFTIAHASIVRLRMVGRR